MTSRAPSPRDIVERVHRLTLDDDVAGQANLYAVDGVLEWPFAPPGVPRRVQGREKIRRLLLTMGRGHTYTGAERMGFHSFVVHQTVDPETIIAELRVGGQLTTAGVIYRIPSIQMFKIRDGEILLCRDYFARVETAGVSRPWSP
jgi:ketosteroid isomerase-like protein